MLNELQERKIDRAFGQLDTNGNGFVERDDVQALGARIIMRFGEAPSSVKGRALLDAFDGIWLALVAAVDRNRDGRLSPPEFRSAMDSQFVNGPNYDQVFHPAAQAVLAVCDTDGDGVLGPAEFHEFQTAMGTSPQDTQEAFAALDRDGDQALSIDELLVAARGFYTAADVAAYGNFLYGPL